MKKLLTGLLNGNITDMDILNLVGLRPSVISGCTIDGSTISLDASGKYAGGLVGYAGAVQVSNTSELADGSKSTTKALNRMLAKTVFLTVLMSILIVLLHQKACLFQQQRMLEES